VNQRRVHNILAVTTLACSTGGAWLFFGWLYLITGNIFPLFAGLMIAAFAMFLIVGGLLFDFRRTYRIVVTPRGIDDSFRWIPLERLQGAVVDDSGRYIIVHPTGRRYPFLLFIDRRELADSQKFTRALRQLMGLDQPAPPSEEGR
jgi:hypothetical protein